MGRKKRPLFNATAIRKAADGLNITPVQNAISYTKYQVTECLQLLKNLYTQPTYTRLVITAAITATVLARAFLTESIVRPI